jgi:hypothetical protein
MRQIDTCFSCKVVSNKREVQVYEEAFAEDTEYLPTEIDGVEACREGL